MKRERPIIFSGPMVRAILDGRKTQTRRVAKLNCAGRVALRGRQWHVDDPNAFLACPYGVPGDRLWVREACRAHELTDKEAREDKYGVVERLGLEFPIAGLDGVVYKADGAFREIENTREAGDRWSELNAFRGKNGATVPSIHMPRWASRITLEVVSVRVERVQAVSHDDAVSEGMSAGVWRAGDGAHRRSPLGSNAVKRFAILWDELNFARGYGWDANPWVWRIEFKRIAPAEREG